LWEHDLLLIPVITGRAQDAGVPHAEQDDKEKAGCGKAALLVELELEKMDDFSVLRCGVSSGCLRWAFSFFKVVEFSRSRQKKLHIFTLKIPQLISDWRSSVKARSMPSPNASI
jgi:hypothetical protein